MVINWVNVILKVKVTLKVYVIPRSKCKCLSFYCQAGGGPLAERPSCFQLSDLLAVLMDLILSVTKITSSDMDI